MEHGARSTEHGARSTQAGILAGRDYFFCERHRCFMSKRACIKRQTKDHTFYDFFPDMLTILANFDQCEGCGQGIENAQSLGVTLKYRGHRITKQMRRREKRDLRTKVEKLGFKTEEEAIRVLSLTHSQAEIGRMLECSTYTVRCRQQEYGITPKGAMD